MVELRNIPEYSPRYVAGSDGRIYATMNTRGNSLVSPRPLKSRLLKDGYVVVQLRKDSKNLNRLVHVLIAAAFIGPKGALDVNHIDGVKANNLPSNLEYLTHSDNCLHAHRIGLVDSARGERCPRSIVTVDDVLAIRAELASLRKMEKMPRGAISALARRYGFKSLSGVLGIEAGITWKHVGEAQ